MEAGPEDEGSPANQMRMGNLKKRTEHGHVVQYKARLVDKGFKQKFGVDYFETYSPVANMSSIRVMLAVVVIKGYVTE